jgi:outer membrane protein assembly factor BamB
VVLLSSCSSLKKYTPTISKVERTKQLRTLWSKNLDPIYNSGNLPIALNAPVIYEGIVYAGDGLGVMHAYNLQDGRELWSKQEVGGFHSAPVIFNDSVIYGTVEGRVFARNRLTGKLIYDVMVGSSVESKGVISDGMIFFHLRGHQLISLDAKTGKILWSYKRAVPYLTTLQGVSTPVVFRDKVYVGFADSYFVAFSKVDGNILWEKKLSRGQKFVDVDVTPVYFNGMFVISSAGGPLQFIDPNSGVTNKVLNIYTISDPVSLGDALIVGTVDGEIVYIDNDYKIVYKKEISTASISTLTQWQGLIYAGTTNGYLISFDAKKSTLFKKRFLGSYASAIFAPPAVSREYMAMLSSRFRLYLFH